MPYDMNTMIYAIPHSQPPIHAMPTELLSEIFDLLSHLSPPPGPGIIPSQITISHVCARWRRVITSISSQWTQLAITHTRHPDVLASFLTWSNTRPISVTIILPVSGVELWPAPRISEFKKTFKHLRKHTSRMQALRIESTTPTLRIIQRLFLPTKPPTPLPTLSYLHLTQTDSSAPLTAFGPLTLNPHTLTVLRLSGVSLLAPAPSLAGLRMLHLTNGPGSLLDQTQLTHPTYPLIPPGPAMPRLTHLHLYRTPPIPTGPPGVFTPSFDPALLVSVTLAHIRTPLDDEQDALIRLFELTGSSPHLRELTLIDFEPRAWAEYTHWLELGLSLTVPRFASVRTLQLVGIHPGMVGVVLLLAFPGVVRFVVVSGVDAGTGGAGGVGVVGVVEAMAGVMGILRDVRICPWLREVVCDGVVYSRPMVYVPAPPGAAA
ncbi:hypothetical protein Hypma_004391 [Hypsizygus marmoreus]|uniref:F-box domain-containing protein n=1 Tax=Hypsizygus marmoreus TaxID=39966 RepID=A0A369JZP8_HYPMA|nr:hypothetical protein Hypma_004391 [Hypsizygus marmoreus]